MDRGESAGESHQGSATAEGLEEHTALKTRSRRVSFAETTAIHFFRREDDDETPPDSSTPGSDIDAREPLDFCVDQSDGDDDGNHGNGTEEEEEEHELFVKNVGDSSPGSGFGSATSNDDYNLFGPVSTSFIRSDRTEGLSENSEDNNHDITLDSTTFSMHFRNVLPHDDLSINSVGSLNTPTGVYTQTDPGNFPSLTGARKKPSGTISGCDVNNDSGMSFVTQRSQKYDYEKLPPGLERLLVKADESMDMAYPQSGVNITSSCVDIVSLESGGQATSLNMDKESPKGDANIVVVCMDKVSPKSGGRVSLFSMDKGPPKSGTNIEEVCMDKVSPRSGGRVSNLSMDKGSPKSGTNIGVVCTDKVSPRSGGRVSSFGIDKESPKDGNIVTYSSIDIVSSMNSGNIASLNMGTVFPKNANELESSHSTRNDSLEQQEMANNEKLHRIHDGTEAANMMDKIYVNPGSSSGNLSGNAFQPDTSSNSQTRTGLSMSAESPNAVKGNVQARGSPYKLHSSPVIAPHFTALLTLDDQKQRSLHSQLHTPYYFSKPDQLPKSPFGGSIISLSDKQQNFLFDPAVSSKNQSISASLGGYSAHSLKIDIDNHGKRISAIKNSISKLKNKSVDGGFRSEFPSQSRKHLQAEFEAALERKTSSSTSICDSFSVVTSNDIPIENQLVSRNVRVQIPAEQTHPINDGLVPVHPRDPIPRLLTNSCHSHDNHQYPEALHKSIPCSDTKIIGKRQSNEELSLMNETERAHKHRKTISEIKDGASASSFRHTVASEAFNTQVEVLAKDWNLVFSKVSEIAEKLLPPANAINLAEIDTLEDKLTDLQRARKFHRLYIDMQSMMKRHKQYDELQKRAAEVKILQDMFVYEKTKLQLAIAKRDALLKKTQYLQSGIEECNRLKCTFTKSYPSYIGKSKLMSSLHHSTHSTIRCDEQNKVSLMRQELEGLEERLTVSRNVFETFCNLKGCTSFDDMIKVINNQLRKKNCCSLILKDLLPWKIVDIQNEADQCHVLVTYHNLLYQRFTCKSLPGSGLHFRNSLNVANIEKRFPKMRACTAFNFIFTTENNCRLDDLKCLQQETQTTSFIFGNLLDLLGEVQTTQLKIGNLISSCFNSPQSQQLKLELSFLNFKTGRRVIFNLDMSDLKSGIYPSEPSELQIQITGDKNRLPSSVSDEILHAIRGLKAGHSVITNVCLCISHAFQ